MLECSHEKLTITTSVMKFHLLQKADGFHLKIKKAKNPKGASAPPNQSNSLEKNPRSIRLT